MSRTNAPSTDRRADASRQNLAPYVPERLHPAGTVPVTIKLARPDRDRLDRVRTERGVSRSALVRQALLEFLDRAGTP